MKDLKKILNRGSEYTYQLLEKFAKFIKRDNDSAVTKSIIKILILLIIYFLLGIVADLMIVIGNDIIYQIGTTARGILSGIWTVVVNFTYFLFIITSIYHLLDIAEKDKDFLVFFHNDQKNKTTKKRVFAIVATIIKILGTLMLLPLFVVDIASLFILGILFGYLRQGIYLISPFITVLGLILFFTVIIFIIKTLLSKARGEYQKYLILMGVSAVLIAGSFIGIILETRSYTKNDFLTTDFNKSTIRHEYLLQTDKNYIISNNDENTNLKLTIDDDLDNSMEIIVSHYTTNEVSTKIRDDGQSVKIAYDEELNLHFKDLEKLFNLGIASIKEKNLYNYTLLKYAQIEVRVSEEYADQIKFVNRAGRTYSPHERNN